MKWLSERALWKNSVKVLSERTLWKNSQTLKGKVVASYAEYCEVDSRQRLLWFMLCKRHSGGTAKAFYSSRPVCLLSGVRLIHLLFASIILMFHHMHYSLSKIHFYHTILQDSICRHPGLELYKALVLPMRVGVTTSQLDLPLLALLHVTSCGRLQLGVTHWATSVALPQWSPPQWL